MDGRGSVYRHHVRFRILSVGEVCRVLQDAERFVDAVVYADFAADVPDVRKSFEFDPDFDIERLLEFLHQLVERQARYADEALRPACNLRIGDRFHEEVAV